ncbi:MAG: hypothetical protein J7K88_02280 [Candidatus Fermentibacteraceae bacterium]|nr:hypothetical protein [Candidatus Fermentibacteraceae bacterium]
MKALVPWLAFVLVCSVSASPVDTAYDLLDAVAWQDGYALENLVSSDLYSAFTEFIDQMRALRDEDPVLVESILQSRYRGRITVTDFESLNNQEILGVLLGEVVIQPDEQVTRETAEMEAGNATVVIHYFNGASVSFQMVWEDGDWRITDTSLLAYLFH